QLRAEDAGQPALARGAHRRNRRRQPERLRQGDQADRRRDERLLRARLLLDEPGSAAADASSRDQDEAAERDGVVALIVFAAHPRGTRKAGEEEVARTVRPERSSASAERDRTRSALPTPCAEDGSSSDKSSRSLESACSRQCGCRTAACSPPPRRLR